MISRRTFLGSVSLGFGSLMLPACKTKVKNEQNDLPGPIAELTSMKDQATSITVKERKARIEKAKHLMKEHNIDAILMMGGTSLDYFTGMKWGISERMLAFVIPQEGASFMVCPAFEEGRAMEQVAEGPLAGSVSILTWEEHESPYRLVVQGMREHGLATSNLGIEETVRYVFSNGISNEASSLNLTSATPVTLGCRGVKSKHELDLMRFASKVTLKAYEAAYKSLKVGMTQADFGRLISLAHEQLGFSGHAGVQVGKYAALPHGSQTPQEVREGVPLLIDGGCGVHGYRSDISRTFVLGKATDKMKNTFDIVLQAQTAALKAAKPRTEAQVVDAAARKVIEDAGYGPGYKYFTHRLGHGMGMDGHEWPYLVKGNTMLLKPRMTFSDEPGIYIPEEFGIRLEDDMVVTENGAELLSPQSHSLEKPFDQNFSI